MTINSLEDKVQANPDVLTMMRNANLGFYVFPMKAEHTNWRDEQVAWANGAVLFDQSYHMTDNHTSKPQSAP